MTKEEFDREYSDLVRHLPLYLERKADDLLSAGIVSLEDYEDDFTLPRIVLQVALECVAGEWGVLCEEDKTVAENFRELLRGWSMI
jgi:hypothetical protein